MTFQIPAKTFLLGEYVALQGGPAIVLTTEPCFEVGLTTATQPAPAIHPASPAGCFWKQSGMTEHLTWFDPYNGIGGLGASSAQFLGAYLAYLSKHHQPLVEQALLDTYWEVSFKKGEGMRPSAYDVLAQAQHGCVYLNRSQSKNRVYAWPFSDIAFVLLHTGEKLATHHHLQALQCMDAAHILSPIVDLGIQAFEQASSALLIEAVNTYYQQLIALDLVASETQKKTKRLFEHPDVLALKGCGAMGADVILALVPACQLTDIITYFSDKNFPILATSRNLYNKNEKKSHGKHLTS
ncbi:MAG: hypothetical protein P1U61_08525 [Legionellaceae bacterium]|nr:hypothetical protein [Legionellaceae bacterium]